MPLSLLTASRVGLVDRVRYEVWIELQENVCRRETAIGQLVSQCASGLREVREFARWPQMGTAFEQADVDAVELERRDEIEHAIVWQQREREVGAGESPLCGLLTEFRLRAGHVRNP